MVLLGAASVALHYWAIDWAVSGMGGLRASAPVAPPMVAQLRLTLPPPVLASSAPPARPRPVNMAPRPTAPVLASAAKTAPETVAEAEAPAPPSATGPEVQAAAPQPVVKPAAEPALAGPRYRVDLPPSARFEFEVKRIDANGTAWTGVAAMTWQHDAAQYQLSVAAGLDMLITRIDLLRLSSVGWIDESGILPVTATEKIKGRALTATHFNRADSRISFSASELSFPLPEGAQDKATLPFQLAGIGRADVKQFAGHIDIVVGEETQVNLFRFVLVGEEEVDTKMGRFLTWHLSRPPKPGTYSSRLDIWLAPARQWYPVQIRNTEASGALTTQTVSTITSGS